MNFAIRKSIGLPSPKVSNSELPCFLFLSISWTNCLVAIVICFITAYICISKQFARLCKSSHYISCLYWDMAAIFIMSMWWCHYISLHGINVMIDLKHRQHYFSLFVSEFGKKRKGLLWNGETKNERTIFTQNLCVFSLPVSLVIIVRICALFLIIVINLSMNL